MAQSNRVPVPRWKREADLVLGRGVNAHSQAPGRELPVDKVLLAIVLGITLFGAVMVYSASAILAEKNYGSQFYFLSRQALWAVAGLVAMAVGLAIDYRHYKRPVVIYSTLVVTLILLVAVFFLPRVNETHRWIRYGALSLQPSEPAKLALIAFLAFFLERRIREIGDFKYTFVRAALVGCVLICLVGAEPDLGTAMALGLVFVTMMFQAGTPIRFFAALAVPAVPAITYMLLKPWRFARLLAFLDPWKYQTTYGFQPVQSMIAIGSGGPGGLGFAQGRQKLFYLPAPHTDFIFAVIGEELGLIGAATLVLMFGLLAWRGYRAARFAPDRFGQLLAVGLTTMIIAQAFFNISVTLSLVPTKGIPLPFVSAGGSSLAISMFAAGVLLNVSKHGKT